MTLSYRPGASFAHRLDPRSKLAFQAAFALAAFVHTTPRGLAALTAVAAVALLAARASPVRVLAEYRFALPLLAAAPLLRALTWGEPWLRPADAAPTLLASYRVLLLFLVGGVYVYTTPVRESRAAIQWLAPGRPGQFLGAGTAFVFRFLPVLQADLARIRAAHAARLGSERASVDRMRLVATAGVDRALGRADAFALALRARCFSWNPTLPALAFGRRDAPVLAVAILLVAAAV